MAGFCSYHILAKKGVPAHTVAKTKKNKKISCIFRFCPDKFLKDVLESDFHMYRLNILQSGPLGCEATGPYSTLSQC